MLAAALGKVGGAGGTTAQGEIREVDKRAVFGTMMEGTLGWDSSILGAGEGKKADAEKKARAKKRMGVTSGLQAAGKGRPTEGGEMPKDNKGSTKEKERKPKKKAIKNASEQMNLGGSPVEETGQQSLQDGYMSWDEIDKRSLRG